MNSSPPPAPSSPSSPSSSSTPRIILYHQTHHQPDSNEPISLLPLLTTPPSPTHIILAALHLNASPGDITLNDHPPSHPKFNTLWAEKAWLQAAGITFLLMLGGAAKGTYARLDGDPESFERFYAPLAEVLREYDFQGVDLDVEEHMSLPGIQRLISRLRADFGREFLLTMAPVATALLPLQPHLSGFSYFELRSSHGGEIAWYNAQFYNGWGDASGTFWYDAIVAAGWAPEKVVLGVLTSGELGGGFVGWEVLERVVGALGRRYAGRFGGVMGWEYFCAAPGGRERPWEWVGRVRGALEDGGRVEGEGVEGVGRQGEGVRPFGTELSAPAHEFAAEKVESLRALGFGQQQVVAALNMTSGNVEQAASLLFAD